MLELVLPLYCVDPGDPDLQASGALPKLFEISCPGFCVFEIESQNVAQGGLELSAVLLSTGITGMHYQTQLPRTIFSPGELH